MTPLELLKKQLADLRLEVDDALDAGSMDFANFDFIDWEDRISTLVECIWVYGSAIVELEARGADKKSPSPSPSPVDHTDPEWLTRYNANVPKTQDVDDVVRVVMGDGVARIISARFL